MYYVTHAVETGNQPLLSLLPITTRSSAMDAAILCMARVQNAIRSSAYNINMQYVSIQTSLKGGYSLENERDQTLSCLTQITRPIDLSPGQCGNVLHGMIMIHATMYMYRYNYLDI